MLFSGLRKRFGYRWNRLKKIPDDLETRLGWKDNSSWCGLSLSSTDLHKRRTKAWQVDDSPIWSRSWLRWIPLENFLNVDSKQRVCPATAISGQVKYFDRKRLSGWLESWEGLLFVTDVSTTFGSHLQSQSQVIVLVSWKYSPRCQRKTAFHLLFSNMNLLKMYWIISLFAVMMELSPMELN